MGTSLSNDSIDRFAYEVVMKWTLLAVEQTPAEMPIEQATEYKIAVNLKTANALRVKVPESVLVRAGEVMK